MEMEKHPIPTRLREFVNETTLEEDDDHVAVTITLCCPRCGGSKFILLWQHVLEGGEVIQTAPVWVACDMCRFYSLLFDRRSDGWDGLVDKRPIRIPECKVKEWQEAKESSYGIRITVQFDKAVADFDERGHLIPDAFHWLSICAEWKDGSIDGAIDFETA